MWLEKVEEGYRKWECEGGNVGKTGRKWELRGERWKNKGRKKD
jgi:hypothetical protein